MILGAHEPEEGERRWRMGGNSCLAGDFYGDWAFDGGREPQVGDRIVFRDMIHYTMVKTTMFNGVPIRQSASGIRNRVSGWCGNSDMKIIKDGCPDLKMYLSRQMNKNL